MTDIARLREFSVPTLASAVEAFGVGAPNKGFTTRPLTCHFPALGTCIGYAATVHASTNRPNDPVDEVAYWRWLEGLEVPGPKIVVLEDTDKTAGGAMWGSANASVHAALGCSGTITQGAVRELDALEDLGFHTFSTALSVARGYGVWTGYGDPVRVAGLKVRTGELVAADANGVLRIPEAISLTDLAAVAAEIGVLEAEISDFCVSGDFSVDGLAELQESVRARWPRR